MKNRSLSSQMDFRRGWDSRHPKSTLRIRFNGEAEHVSGQADPLQASGHKDTIFIPKPRLMQHSSLPKIGPAKPHPGEGSHSALIVAKAARRTEEKRLEKLLGETEQRKWCCCCRVLQEVE
ncbi:hypothetical protein EYF80_056733 [Liparis tanakae]|uniref:Uncharacterized protein n=1 Tax=Liparis tanakae TaxID=230148 RepID=A0A4Z2EXY4_9TELE|nr:hypothetical protein EYF80_056733 [Liparis tanakae]